MKNAEHSTFNIQRRMGAPVRPPWALGVECWLLNVPKFVLIFAVQLYRWTISPALLFLFGADSGCRFTPTCSQYAIDALREHGVVAGGWLAAKRICRCHPWGGCGHDPIPKSGRRKAERRDIWEHAH